VGLGRVERRREFNVVSSKVTRILQPFFHRAIGVRITNLPRREFMQSRRQHGDLSKLRVELLESRWARNSFLHCFDIARHRYDLPVISCRHDGLTKSARKSAW